MSKFAHALRLFLAAVLIWAPVQAQAGMFFDPNGTGKLKPSLRQGLSGPVQWTGLNGKIVALGDSRTANGGSSAGLSSGNFASNLGPAGAYAGVVQAALNNTLLMDQDWQFGIGATTTESLVDRYTKANVNNPNSGISWVAGSNTGTGSVIGASTQTPVGPNTGAIFVGNKAVAGAYKLTFTSATAFQVTDPSGNVVATGSTPATTSGSNAQFGTQTGTVSTYPIPDYQVAGKVTQGATAFVSGDSFTLTVAGPINPAWNLTGDIADMAWNASNVAGVTATTIGANLALVLCSTNDSGYFNNSGLSPSGIGRSLANLATTIDGLIAAGKKVVLLNEVPRGIGFSQNYGSTNTGRTDLTFAETPLASQISGATIQASQTFYQDGSDFGLGSGVYNTATETWYTRVASSPATGQYSVSSTGLYTFNASDPIFTSATATTAMLNYVSQQKMGSSSWVQVVNAWANSSDPAFSYAGTSYGLPGAKFGRSDNLEVADSWGAMLDPNPLTAGAIQAKPGVLADGLHMMPYGARLMAKSVVDAIARRTTAGLTVKAPAAVRNGYWRIATANGALKTWSATLPGIMKGAPSGLTRVQAGTLVSALDVPDSVGADTGTFSGSGISGTITYSTGAVTVSTTAAPVVNQPILATQDLTNLLYNGLFDPLNATGTAVPTNWTGDNIPFGWTASTSGLTVGSGGTQIAVSTSGFDDDGYPRLRLTLSGHASASGSITFQTAVSPINLLQQTDQLRMAATSKISAGTNGHLSGITGVGVSLFMQSSASFVRAGYTVAANARAQTGALRGGGDNAPMNDLDVAAGPLKQRIVSLPVTVAGTTPSNLYGTIVVDIQAGPVSAVVDLSRADLGPKTW